MPIFLVAQQEDSALKNRKIPFATVQKAPVFPGCENPSERQRRNCLQDQVRKHITQNFNKSIFDSLAVEPGKQRIYMQFMFGTDGKIHDIKSRAFDPKLEKGLVKKGVITPEDPLPESEKKSPVE